MLPTRFSVLLLCVCTQGYVYSSASRLVGVELSEDFVRMQNEMLQKYKMTDRVQVCLGTPQMKSKDIYKHTDSSIQVFHFFTKNASNQFFSQMKEFSQFFFIHSQLASRS